MYIMLGCHTVTLSITRYKRNTNLLLKNHIQENSAEIMGSLNENKISKQHTLL